jgi:anaerobic magnesium-protoporphyrin IX monomethyl ester cyclase
MKKIMFITVPYSCWGVQVVGTWPPLHIVYLAGAAEQAEGSAVILDAMNKNLSIADIKEKIISENPDIVMTFDYLPVTGAISTATVNGAIEILNTAKEYNSDITTILGGPHPTFMYNDILSDTTNKVDIIIRGEGEETLSEIIKLSTNTKSYTHIHGIAYTENGIVQSTPERKHIQNLDSLSPAWHLLDWDDYRYNVYPEGKMASILTSRGCDMACAFCSQRMFWKENWRSRTPENSVKEILHLKHTYDITFFTLIDPYPTKDRERWEKFLDLLIDQKDELYLLIETRVEDIIRDKDILHKYREAGIIHIYIGAESADHEVLNGLNKGTAFEQNKEALDLLRNTGIVTEASFMIGFPEETHESIKKTIDSAILLNPDIAVFPVVTPMPFTPLYNTVKDRIRVHDLSKYNLVTPIIEPYNMSMDDITASLSKCYMSFYKNKMKEVLSLKPGFKKKYLLSAFKLMMRDYGQAFDFSGSMGPHS